MNDRLKWVLVRRRRLASVVEGFTASRWTSIGFEVPACMGDRAFAAYGPSERVDTFRDAASW